jgi:uncharacterized protein YggU (UPF0235/DUF167 family)
LAGAEAPWTAEPDGVTLWLRLTPKGGREDGRANAALIELIAKALAAPKRAVTIRSGETSRLKKLFIAGDPAPIIDALARLAPTKD